MCTWTWHTVSKHLGHKNIICCPDFISLSIPCVLVDSSVWVDPGIVCCTYQGLTD